MRGFTIYFFSLEQPWLSRESLAKFANCIFKKSGAPGESQRILIQRSSSGTWAEISICFCPNGLIANFYGPVEGRRHDSSLLAESKLLQKLNVHSFAPDETPLCQYDDPALPQMTGFKGAVTPQQHAFNEKMNSVRVTVEWICGDIVRFFAFMDFKKDLKVNLSPWQNVHGFRSTSECTHLFVW